MAWTRGMMRLMSRSCLVPMNRATTRSKTCSTRMLSFAVCLSRKLPSRLSALSVWIGSPCAAEAVPQQQDCFPLIRGQQTILSCSLHAVQSGSSDGGGWVHGIHPLPTRRQTCSGRQHKLSSSMFRVISPRRRGSKPSGRQCATFEVETLGRGSEKLGEGDACRQVQCPVKRVRPKDRRLLA